ncbi:MAG: 6,7-dimethyl-8-ribityllumazine synthase [Bdellovibrionota bacterium]
MSPKIAIIVSRFNEEITSGLLKGALKFLESHNIKTREQDIFTAPGAFEIPLIAQTLANSGSYSGVICLGCIIKGDTAHFEFISLGATIGIIQSMLNTETPVSFGILTTYNEEQALARSRNDAENKGREAAAACLEMIQILERIAESH